MCTIRNRDRDSWALVNMYCIDKDQFDLVIRELDSLVDRAFGMTWKQYIPFDRVHGIRLQQRKWIRGPSYRVGLEISYEILDTKHHLIYYYL